MLESYTRTHPITRADLDREKRERERVRVVVPRKFVAQLLCPASGASSCGFWDSKRVPGEIFKSRHGRSLQKSTTRARKRARAECDRGRSRVAGGLIDPARPFVASGLVCPATVSTDPTLLRLQYRASGKRNRETAISSARESPSSSERVRRERKWA